MTWVKEVVPDRGHECQFPDLIRGQMLGSLWRCNACHTLWRLAEACDLCDSLGDHQTGQCMVGQIWRRAYLYQRLWHWPAHAFERWLV